jgi:hypothetical protein
MGRDDDWMHFTGPMAKPLMEISRDGRVDFQQEKGKNGPVLDDQGDRT